MAELNQALKTLLAPERLTFLLLGADAPLVRAVEQEGLGPVALVGAAN